MSCLEEVLRLILLKLKHPLKRTLRSLRLCSVKGSHFPVQGLNHLAAKTTAVIMSAPNNEATAIARRGTPSRQAPTSAQEEKGR